MRIVYLGSPAPAAIPLEKLLNLKDHQVVAVVSQPARATGRSRSELIDPPVAVLAKSRGLRVLQPESARAPDFLDELRQLHPDVAITAAYGQILNNEFLSIPSRATINIHPSLLPSYRGATPVQSALLDGAEETGVTILFTVRALDAGNVISRQATPIEQSETTRHLLPRLFALGAELLPDALTRLADKSFCGEPQNASAVTHCCKITKKDGLIDWGQPAATIVNRFRAFDPWPGVYTNFLSRRIVVTAMSLPERRVGDEDRFQGEVGAFEFDRQMNALIVRAKSSNVLIKRVKPAGGKEIEASQFCNGIKESGQCKFLSEEPRG